MEKLIQKKYERVSESTKNAMVYVFAWWLLVGCGFHLSADFKAAVSSLLHVKII